MSESNDRESNASEEIAPESSAPNPYAPNPSGPNPSAPEHQVPSSEWTLRFIGRDATSGIVVFLVALPLCLGIALACGAPLMSGLLAGIIGGLVVGVLSGSPTSVSGPAAGLTAVVIAQIEATGSFEAFLLAVALGGVIQIGLGIARAGALSAFFPSSVIKGLLAAIGVILILKQIPHALGHDTDPEGQMAFQQPDNENTFSEYVAMINDMHLGAAVIGITCIILLMIWGRVSWLKKSLIPGPLVVVILGVVMKLIFDSLGGAWKIDSTHLVDIPVGEGMLTAPDWSAWTKPAVYVGAVTIAIVASLETLLNLEAVDKLDQLRRNSPPNRELLAQGAGNLVAGLIGGLPVTSVIIRGSVNVASGSRTKYATIIHGFLLLIFVVMFPTYLNTIPLSSLAAILLVTGFKLASPQLFKQMWSEGRYQFIPFLVTLLAIVFTNILIGILIGLGISALFILNSNVRRPIRRVVESHLDGEITHIELANQVSFLNRAALDRIFDQAQPGSHVVIDATDSDYIDPDILSLIRDFVDHIGPARDVNVSLRGFRSKYRLSDVVRYADYSTRELQDRASPQEVLKVLEEGNERFRTGKRLNRDYRRQILGTASGQSPMAAVLSCIDSRVPAELIFDLGIGDIFSVRVAGNVVGTKSVASLEYSVAIAGAKLVVVLGHTRCGAVGSTVKLLSGQMEIPDSLGCQHLPAIVQEIGESFDASEYRTVDSMNEEQLEAFIDKVAMRNVRQTMKEIVRTSPGIKKAVEEGRAMVVGGLYDVRTGKINFYEGD